MEENQTNNSENVPHKENHHESHKSEHKEHTSEKELIERRKKKIIESLKKNNLWFLLVLIILVILGVYIRTLPMQDHNPDVAGNQPGLWDITTNTWTLGPDLDPFLFMRNAKIIVEQGSLPRYDYLRNFPLGYDNSIETELLPYMIAWTYYIFNIFSSVNLEYAAVIFPVIMFALTIIIFFLFVREIFINKDKESKTKANIIASISSLFIVVIPVLLSRTIAGIPEKESAGFFFMFLAFYLYLIGEKSENLKKAVVFSILSGIATALMGLIWGGVTYIFVIIGIANLAAFLLNKVQKKEFIVYLLWAVVSFSLLVLFTDKYTLISLVTSISNSIVTIGLIIIAVHLIIYDTKLAEIKFIKNSKLSKNILSLIISLVLIFLLILIFLGPSFIMEKMRAVNQMMFRPLTGRWVVTVAENKQPYFTEWAASFGPYIKNIPVMFWLFFLGSILLFREMFNKIKKKDALI